MSAKWCGDDPIVFALIALAGCILLIGFLIELGMW